jgi:Rieske Fe-S protein
MAQRTTGRRRFLKLAGASTALLASACGTSEDGPSGATGPIAAGNARDVPVGTLRGVGDQPLVIGRDASGLYAVSTICTHQRCNIRTSGQITANGFDCNCHGSRYDANGSVTRGPATRALDHYQVKLEADGSIIIYAGQVVDKDARIAVPG